MSFLVALLLPVIATVILFRSLPERVARGKRPAELTTASALTMGALTGAGALVFLGLLGVGILAYRGKMVTPEGIGIHAAAFWAVQFAISAVIGAAVGALTALALLPWVRQRLGRSVPGA